MSIPVRAPDLAELETLVACTAEGSLVAAAARLGISSPVVAKRIRNLEALAGQPLLRREGRRMRLTDDGATLLAGARRILEDRDALVSLLSEIRDDDPSPVAGLRELLGRSSEASRAAQRPEARLAETERVFELVLCASATGVVICNPDTAVIHEVNDAFCRFTGRSRSELLSLQTTDKGGWYDTSDRDRLIDAVRHADVAKRVVVRAVWPDGTVRVGEATAKFITLAGIRQMLSTVDDVTERRVRDAERRGSLSAYHALTRLAALLVAGRPAVESIGGILHELRRSCGFATALLWDAKRGRPFIVDGEQPPPELDQELSRAKPLPDGIVMQLDGMHFTTGIVMGWMVPLASANHSLILLSTKTTPASAQALVADVLTDFATLALAGT